MSDVQIKVVRVPSIFGIAMQFAPLVRLGVITDLEGQLLVNHHYYSRCMELRQEEIPG